MDFMQAVNHSTLPVKKFAVKHDSAILTLVSMTATAGAAYFAFKDGPKAEKILREKREQGASNTEKAKAILPVYGRTIMCVAVAWGASILNHKRSADKIIALTEALSLARSLREETKRATVETVGEEKAQEIEKKVVTKRVSSEPVIMSEIENTGHGRFIFREPMTGKTFKASKDFIELIVDRHSNELMKYHKGIRGDIEYRAYADEDYEVSMTDIFEDIGLSHCGFADLFVWPAREFDCIDVNLNNTFEYIGPDGTPEPGYILDFYTKPVLGYSSYSSSRGGRY